jgi:hypothetical protein
VFFLRIHTDKVFVSHGLVCCTIVSLFMGILYIRKTARVENGLSDIYHPQGKRRGGGGFGGTSNDCTIETGSQDCHE